MTTWLILAAVALIAGYLGFSSWRERMNRRPAERMFAHARSDGGLLEEDVPASTLPDAAEDVAEGIFDPAPDALAQRLEAIAEPDAAEPEAAEQLSFYTPAPAAEPLIAAAEPVAVPLPKAHLNLPEPSLVEAVVSLVFDKPGRVSLTHLIDRLQSVGCNLRLMGLNEAGELEKPTANRAYQRIDVYLLLASRRGPVADGCVSRFVDEMQVFASSHALALSGPDRDEILKLAQALDAFCEKVDVVTSLSVVAPEGYPFRGSAIHRLASDVGMKWSATGAYVMLDDAGSTLFSLINNEPQAFLPAGAEMTTHGFNLSLEVPRVRDGLSVFAHMTSIARMMADRLSGQVVDADGRPLTSQRLQEDHDRLQDVYERMAARGIPAGSEAALSVFA